MPWCEECAKYFAPSGLTVEGHCPACGRDVEAPDDGQGADGDVPSAPWHFKLMIVALVVYLVWRFADLVT